MIRRILCWLGWHDFKCIYIGDESRMGYFKCLHCERMMQKYVEF